MADLLASIALRAQRNDDGWVVPKERFASTVRRIAALELAVSPVLAEAGAVQRKLTSLITAQLETVGFEVTPVTECVTTWESICSQVGDLTTTGCGGFR